MRLPDLFLEDDADLTLTHLHGLVTDELVSLDDVCATLECLRTSSQVGPNLRVAVDGGYRQDVRQQVIDSDPEYDGEPLTSWAQRLFGSRPFYVVVNELEVFNPALVRRVARLLRPLIESQAAWFGGLSMALLIGREGFTSFGVHRDSDCRWNLQFHLGPAPKTMTVWQDDALAEATDADLLAVAPLLSRGLSFELQRGDLFVLPCQERHAAHYTDLAVTLVASMRVVSARGLAEAALRRSLDEQYRGASSTPIGLSRPELGAAAAARREISGQEFEQAVEAERLRRWSNLGMTVRNPDPLPNAAVLRGASVALVDPFPVCHQQLPGARLRVFARGHVLAITHDDAVVELIEQLNTGATVVVGPDAPPTILMLLAFLCGHGAAAYESRDDC
ncbi:MAG: hypothetical protein PVJ51_09885 [Acidobacteriota bacterium]